MTDYFALADTENCESLKDTDRSLINREDMRFKRVDVDQKCHEYKLDTDSRLYDQILETYKITNENLNSKIHYAIQYYNYLFVHNLNEKQTRQTMDRKPTNKIDMLYLESIKNYYKKILILRQRFNNSEFYLYNYAARICLCEYKKALFIIAFDEDKARHIYRYHHEFHDWKKAVNDLYEFHQNYLENPL
jgi:hypothetical protein